MHSVHCCFNCLLPQQGLARTSLCMHMAVPQQLCPLWMGQPVCMQPLPFPSSTLYLGRAAPHVHAAMPYLLHTAKPCVQVPQCFADSAFSPGLSPPCTRVAAPHYLCTCFGMGSPVCRYCSLLLTSHCVHKGSLMHMCNPVDVLSSTLPYLLDQSQGGGAPHVMFSYPLVHAVSGFRRGDWEVLQWSCRSEKEASQNSHILSKCRGNINIALNSYFSLGWFSELPESSHGSPTFSTQSLSLICYAEAVQLTLSLLLE